MSKKRDSRGNEWVDSLLAWFAANRRVLPWRGNGSAYRVWISEIMLQQTQVETVIPYFNRFMKQFPTVKALAEADMQDVLKAWEGLGYYSRARNLKTAAEDLRVNHNGRLPRTADALSRLKGIGPYTAAAIASIRFGERAPVVDGNVIRVMARFRALDWDFAAQKNKRMLADFMQPFVPADVPGDFNEAMMELGALICRPTNPACTVCPLSGWCRAYQNGNIDRFPAKRMRAAVPRRIMACGVVFRKGCVLLTRRPEKGMLGGLWHFPRLVRSGRERLDVTAVRAIRKETGLTVRPLRKLCRVNHTYSHFQMLLHAFVCEPTAGRARAKTCAEVRWAKPEQLSDLPLSTADRKVADMF